MRYDGPINLKKMPPYIKRIYNLWRGQKARCYQKRYAADVWQKQKISVEYSARDFINWFLKNDKSNGKTRYGCGRIDHTKNYAFGNIQLQTPSQNSIEVRCRTKKQRASKIIIREKQTDKIIDVVYGTIDAEKITGLHRSNVYRCLQENRKPKKCKFYFQYQKEVKREN